jgi:hypothetical protein
MQFTARSFPALIAAATLSISPAVAAEFDVFQYEVQARDAERFARLFEETHGRPTADQIARHYLQGAGRGVEVFKPGRIEDAAHMARRVARLNDDYRHAIDTCLPLTADLTRELRAVYLAYQGLLPGYPLPQIHLVFGAGNSGGTASADAQVLGLEVACRSGIGPDEYRRYMRTMFAHETAHSWQPQVDDSGVADLLLFTALREGTPDYLAGLVTGATPSSEREAFARPKEQALWAQFQQDRRTLLARGTDEMSRESPAGQAYYRWFANFRGAPDDWPYELGYWVGMQIAAHYVERATDKRRAIRELLELDDPQAILAASGYRELMETD